MAQRWQRYSKPYGKKWPFIFISYFLFSCYFIFIFIFIFKVKAF